MPHLPFASRRSLGLALALLLALLTTREGLASGGGHIEITRDEIQIELATPRRTPAPGTEKAWYDRVNAWTTENQPIADKAIVALEKLLPAYRAKLGILAKRFDDSSVSVLDAEGVAEREANPSAPWRIDIDLDLFPGTSNSSKASIVCAKRPRKADVRAFSREVQATVLALVNRTVPRHRYTAYWLRTDTATPALLLTSVPLDRLDKALRTFLNRGSDLVSLRRAPALLLTTHRKKTIKPTDDEALLAHAQTADVPTAPPIKATAAEVTALFASGTKQERALHPDAYEFLTTLVITK